MGAARPFRQAGEMWCSEDSESPVEATGPLRYPFSDARGLRLAFLEAADQVGHVGGLLLEIALVFLEPPKQRLRVWEASAPAAAAVPVMSPSVHVFHLLSS